MLFVFPEMPLFLTITYHTYQSLTLAPADTFSCPDHFLSIVNPVGDGRRQEAGGRRQEAGGRSEFFIH